MDESLSSAVPPFKELIFSSLNFFNRKNLAGNQPSIYQIGRYRTRRFKNIPKKVSGQQKTTPFPCVYVYYNTAGNVLQGKESPSLPCSFIKQNSAHHRHIQRLCLAGNRNFYLFRWHIQYLVRNTFGLAAEDNSHR